MKNIFETLEDNYILFEKVKIIVIIDNSDKIWFNSKQLTQAIGYSDSRDALKKHTDEKDREYLKNINHSYNISQQPMSVYLTEAGMYKLILRSKMPKTEKFSNRVTDEVLPSIRKFGLYELKKSSEKDRDSLLEKINYLEKQTKLMKNDMKKNKYPDGALVYVIDYSDDNDKVDGIFRIEKTDNLKKRKQIYDTHMLHNKPVILKKLCNNPLQLETCLISMLYDYKYKNKKSFYICKKSVIVRAFKNCIKSINNMNQTGGELNFIDKLNKNLIKLNKQIDNTNKLLNI